MVDINRTPPSPPSINHRGKIQDLSPDHLPVDDPGLDAFSNFPLHPPIVIQLPTLLHLWVGAGVDSGGFEARDDVC